MTGQHSSQWLSLREAAEELGVHYMTAYRYVRLGLLHAAKVGSVWQVDRADLDAFIADQAGDGEEESGRTDAPWSKRLEARLLAADQAGSWQVIESALAAGMTPARIYTEVIGPAMRRIGDRWEAGTLGIGEEHVATAVANRLIGRLGPRFTRRGRTRGTIIATTVSGERHILGLEMLADILRGAGYDVVMMGADVPLESLQVTLEQIDRLIAVCVSVMVMEDPSSVEETIAAIKTHAPTLPVLLGGAAIPDEEAAQALGADAWAADGVTALSALERLTS